MPFNDRKSEGQVVEYRPEDTFGALIAVLQRSSRYKIRNVDQMTHTIYVSTGMGWRSWGENLTLTVYSHPGGNSELQLTSTCKYGLVDWGRNQDNLDEIMTMLRNELSLHCRKVIDPAAVPGSADIPTQIRKLSELRDAGILTDAEFENKKADLLSRL